MILIRRQVLRGKQWIGLTDSHLQWPTALTRSFATAKIDCRQRILLLWETSALFLSFPSFGQIEKLESGERRSFLKRVRSIHWIVLVKGITHWAQCSWALFFYSIRVENLIRSIECVDCVHATSEIGHITLNPEDYFAPNCQVSTPSVRIAHSFTQLHMRLFEMSEFRVQVRKQTLGANRVPLITGKSLHSPTR